MSMQIVGWAVLQHQMINLLLVVSNKGDGEDIFEIFCIKSIKLTVLTR